ncbi:cytochrome P450 [Aquibium microcysteis]|uniref:cytochrome P450 n=1 Tax=Aquibium microcysteis TaxID=675281 RepID=UPI001EF1A549|nr:cytochrome P450 [Aquibium microcysteis]
MQTKYFDGIRKAQASQRPAHALPPFDPERLRTRGLLGKVVGRLMENPRGWLSLLRRWWPNPKIGNFVLVTRAADVREVFERQDVFHTPFGPEMMEMADGSNFILGMQDGAAYRKLKSPILTAFPPDEVERRVRPIARRHADDIMRTATPGFDAVDELLKIVPVRVCRDYFGMAIDDDAAFSDWSIALSTLFFADPAGNADTRELAVVAANHMLAAIDRSIERAQRGEIAADTPLARLVLLNEQRPEVISIPEIRSVMMGMISGFAPTNLLAAGNCLDVILSMPEARAAVVKAVKGGDDAALDRAILEAMRFKPIFVGPFRYAAVDTVIARGTPRERFVPKGATVMPSILSAMFDAESVVDPERFDPDRSCRDYMVYGHGIHWCIGSAIARVQIGECFRALFMRPGLRRAEGRAGRLSRRGAFPERLCVTFDTDALSRTVPHAFVTIAAPVASGVDVPALRDEVARLGNPATGGIRAALDDTRAVHFASLSVIGSADPRVETVDGRFDVVLEFSADGSEAEAIALMAEKAGPFLRTVFEKAGVLPAGRELTSFLLMHSVRVGPGLRTPAGLVFTGTPGHGVARIKAEACLEAELRAELSRLRPDPDETALARLQRLRRHLAELGGYDWAFQPAPHGLEGPTKPLASAFLRWLTSWKALGGSLAVLTLLSALYARVAFSGAQAAGGALVAWLAALSLALLTILFLAGGTAGLLYWRLRRAEERDAEKGAPLPPDRFEPIAAGENHVAQNHLAAVSVMKPGWLRRLTLRLTFLAIKIAATRAFEPGRLSDIGSIHYARWVLLPGTDKLLFFSNYGGSWESYLEDFITKAHAGLTGVWSNTAGFPRTRNLFQEGATNGAQFKLWAREQQIPTLFWYSAYPELTTFHIRRNAAIREAVAGARTETDAAALLSSFGSAPLPARVLETDEIQSIAFGGMGRLQAAEMIALRLPESPPAAERAQWLDFVLANASFGARVPEREAMTVAFSAAGLRKLGLADEGVAGLPTVFLRGMAAPGQDRVLGDVGENAAVNWAWGHGDAEADAILVCYATPARIAGMIATAIAEAEVAGMRVIHRLPLIIKTDSEGRALEHFGYRDGISQPVIEGTPRARGPVHPQHKVAAGEFLLGYPDQTGKAPPPIAVPAGFDRGQCLSPLAVPPVGGEGRDWRDFGRNGSFLVVRQLVQHVDRFETFCRRTAEGLGEETIDGRPATEWVGAKMFGRWKDGASLVRNPVRREAETTEGRRKDVADNGFLYEGEDPQGLACPLGAHARRSNPRDSLGKDPQAQIELAKRHRLLRISRAFQQDDRKGILFMCLNADIERQFEFVQQTWVMNPNFQTLHGEQDPIVGHPAGDGAFTVPTRHGPLVFSDLQAFVTVAGGGYFFMPGRRALQYLRSQADTGDPAVLSLPGHGLEESGTTCRARCAPAPTNAVF